MKYRVLFPTEKVKKKFHKALETITPQKIQEEIMEAIQGLADNPRPAGEPKIKPPLIVYQFTAQYRLRVRNYPILYDVDDKNEIVWVLDVRRRDERTYK